MALNVTISWHGTAVTLSRSRLPTSIPAANVKNRNTCSTKCNNNDWCGPGNGDTIDVTVLLLWFYPSNGANAFPDSFLILSAPTVSLKDPQIRNGTILLTVGMIRWNKVTWVLATQKQELFVINTGRERISKDLWTDTKRHPPAQPTSQRNCFQLITDYFFKIR